MPLQQYLIWVGALGSILVIVPVLAIIVASRRRHDALRRANQSAMALLAQHDLAEERRTVIEMNLAHFQTSMLARQGALIGALGNTQVAQELMETNRNMREGMKLVLEILAATERVPEDHYQEADLTQLARLTAINWEASSRPNRPAVIVSACEHPTVLVPAFEARRAMARAMDYVTAIMAPSVLSLRVDVIGDEAILEIAGDCMEMADDTTANRAHAWAFVAQRLTIGMGGQMELGSTVKITLPLVKSDGPQRPLPLDLTRRMTKLQAQFG